MESTLSLLEAQDAVLLPEREELQLFNFGDIIVHFANVHTVQVNSAINLDFGGGAIQEATAAGVQAVSVTQ